MYKSKYFFRDTSLDKAYEHTGFTKGSLIKQGIDDLGIRNTTEEETLFKYSKDEIMFTEENAICADNIEINYSSYQTTSYEYDEKNKAYLRSMSGEKHIDAISGKQYTAKNIIVYEVNSRVVDDYGRIDLDNIGSGEGYYITNGYARKIMWQKTSRNTKTIYKYKDTNEEIIINDGNTWVQIMPFGKYLGITSNNNE